MDKLAKVFDKRKMIQIRKNLVNPLRLSVSSSGGRNRFGRVTVRGRGSHSWRHSCRLDWLRRLQNEVGEIVGVQSDPSRTAEVALGFFRHLGLFGYQLAAEGLRVGTSFTNASSPYATIFARVARLDRKGSGNSYPLQTLSVGVHLFGLELLPNRGGVLARAAGTSVRILQKLKVVAQTFVAVRLSSGQLRYLHGSCRGVLGQVSNSHHRVRVLGMAGVRRRLGFRSKVRGVAMNPVDHPHGGGEGKTSGGRPSVSPWGWLTKGKKTVSPKLRRQRARWVNKIRHGRSLVV